MKLRDRVTECGSIYSVAAGSLKGFVEVMMTKLDVTSSQRHLFMHEAPNVCISGIFDFLLHKIYVLYHVILILKLFNNFLFDGRYMQKRVCKNSKRSNLNCIHFLGANLWHRSGSDKFASSKFENESAHIRKRPKTRS